MARSIETIQAEIFRSITSNPQLQELNSVSKSAIYRLFIYIVAVAIYTLEMLFDIHEKEIDNALFNQKGGRLPWYRTMALNFQYGFDLVPDKDYFDNSSATQEQIQTSKIIKYAAVNESEDESRIIIKIAGEVGQKLSNFTDPAEIEAIEAYFKEIKWPGKITIINFLADKLYLNIQIKRDALVLNENGMSKLVGNYPVVEALQAFMKELPFNGELKLSALVDKLQLIPGVIDATLLSAESACIVPELSGYGVPQSIFVSKIAESGYFDISTFDNIAYVV